MTAPTSPRPAPPTPPATPPVPDAPADTGRDDIAPADESAMESLGRAVGEAVLGGASPHHGKPPAPGEAGTPPGDTPAAPARPMRLSQVPQVAPGLLRSGRRR